MVVPLTTAFTNALLNILRGSSVTGVSPLYVGLFNGVPGSGGVEVTGGGSGYARQLVTLTAPSNGTVQNAADVVFGPIVTAWGTFTHVALMDGSGTVYAYAAFIGDGSGTLITQTITLPAGTLTWSLTSS